MHHTFPLQNGSRPSILHLCPLLVAVHDASFDASHLHFLAEQEPVASEEAPGWASKEMCWVLEAGCESVTAQSGRGWNQEWAVCKVPWASQGWLYNLRGSRGQERLP